MKKSYLTNGSGIVINIITDGRKGYVECAVPNGQFGFIRTTSWATDIEIKCMIDEMKKLGYNYTEEN